MRLILPPNTPMELVRCTRYTYSGIDINWLWLNGYRYTSKLFFAIFYSKEKHVDFEFLELDYLYRLLRSRYTLKNIIDKCVYKRRHKKRSQLYILLYHYNVCNDLVNNCLNFLP